MTFAAAPPAPPARPSTVNIAVILLYAAAGLELLNVVLNLAYYGAVQDGMKEAVQGTSMENQTGSQSIGQIASVIIGILIAVIFVLLAVFVGRGKQVARILTWVLGGLSICCGLSLFGLSALGKAAWDSARKNDPALPTYDRYNQLLSSHLPGWYTPVTTTVGIVAVVGILVAVILLALPPSHPFFRKVAAPAWEPPVPPTTTI